MSVVGHTRGILLPGFPIALHLQGPDQMQIPNGFINSYYISFIKSSLNQSFHLRRLPEANLPQLTVWMHIA